jgi:hypothetical protein
MQQTKQPKQPRSIPWNFLATLLLIAAAAYAWPDVLTAIQKGAFEGAKVGAEAGMKAAVKEIAAETKAEIKGAIDEALPWR